MSIKSDEDRRRHKKVSFYLLYASFGVNVLCLMWAAVPSFMVAVGCTLLIGALVEFGRSLKASDYD